MSKIQPLKKVAIVGATGHIGKIFVTALVENGKHELTALTRSESRGTLPGIVKCVQVDFSNQDLLVEALKGQEFLIITLAVTVAPGVHNDIVNAAVKAGVSYVMPNFYGCDIRNPKLGQETFGAIIEQQITEMERLGMPYISLACGTWYEWSMALGESWFGFNILERKVTFFDDGKTTVNVSTWPQCGRAVVALLNLPQSDTSPSLADWRNEPVYITSFSISQRDMLDSLHRILGTSDVDWEIKFEATSKRLQDGINEYASGMLTGIGKAMYARLFMRSQAGEPDFPGGLANETLGLPAEDLDEATRVAVQMVQSGWNPLAR
ncbi:hypothetical protein DE146DRAFT_497297 [Phaeosphaeria sp. MPI-PUGE-AT-0046c]|nr:hypothetical protein DE146DRAFT_497297 [Phaeosphaeria sp. MPI-PUGE-AT-0046c]